MPSAVHSVYKCAEVTFFLPSSIYFENIFKDLTNGFESIEGKSDDQKLLPLMPTEIELIHLIRHPLACNQEFFSGCVPGILL